MDTREFLQSLFAEKPQNSFITIFTLPNRTSKFFEEVDQAAVYVQRINNQQQNIYFGTNLQGEVKLQGRGKANDSIGTVCFYTDVDMECLSAHTKCDLPKSEADAYSILKGFGWDPSLVVNSGYGLHVYWIFKEPWIFRDDADRERCERLLIRLQATIRERANQKGWTLDYTHDLSRILRVPDTWNIKVRDNPVEVKVIESNGLRYNPEDIEPFLIDEIAITKSKSLPSEIKSKIQHGLLFDASAEAPKQKLEQLLDVNFEFKASWHANRNEFQGDPSRFAQSIANYTAQANWTDQEICNALIHWYRLNLNNPKFLNRADPISMEKIMRPVKIATTIGKARAAATEISTKEYLEDVAPAEDSGMGEIVDPDGNKARAFLESSLRIKIIALKKYIPQADNEPFFEMKVSHKNEVRTATFKDSEHLYNQTRFRYRIGGIINNLPQVADKATWTRVTAAFEKITEEISVVTRTETVEGKIGMWLEQFLEKKPTLDIIRGHATTSPFIHKGFWYIFPKPFGDWAYQNKGSLEGASKIETDLRRIGATSKVVDYKSPEDKKRIQFHAWRIPHEIMTPPPTLIVDNTKLRQEDDESDAKAMP